MRKRFGFLTGLVSVSLVAPLSASANGVGPQGNPAITPASSGLAAVHGGALETGAGGVYQPISPDSLPPGGSDPVDPRRTPPSATNPQGQLCPTVTTRVFHIGASWVVHNQPPGSILRVFAIYPNFIRNVSGGYDGHDATFDYNAPNVVPAGGDPKDVRLGALATAANIAGHSVAVPTFIQAYGHWQDSKPTPPYGGYCVGATYAYGAPYIAGDNPPPSPPASVISSPPFAVGASLMADVTRFWRVGNVETLPGPQSTAHTYVHIPTCAWLNSDVPTSPVQFHAIKTAASAGFTLFLVYTVTVTPGEVTWDWGDGTQSRSFQAAETPPPTFPTYDPTSQTWTEPCAVAHAYDAVSSGRNIDATQSFTATITVTWSDGIVVHAQPVVCAPNPDGQCALQIGPEQGWRSGPHPVDQIEPVPFNGSTG